MLQKTQWRAHEEAKFLCTASDTAMTGTYQILHKRGSMQDEGSSSSNIALVAGTQTGPAVEASLPRHGKNDPHECAGSVGKIAELPVADTWLEHRHRCKSSRRTLMVGIG